MSPLGESLARVNPAAPAAMSWEDDDWEADDIDAKLTLPGGGKEEETWSDEEGHDAHKQPDAVAVGAAAAAIPAPPPAPPKPKTGLAKKIEEREAREKQENERREALRNKLQGDAAVEISEDMDEATAERLRRKKLEEAADLDNAIDAFGLDHTKQSERAGRGEADEAGAFDSLQPKSDADFEKLAALVQKKLAPYEGTKGHLACLKALLRAATDNMSVEDTKDLNSFVSVISNAKLAAERDKDKGKKTKSKGKGKLNLASSKASEMDMGGGGEYDDFM